MAAWERDVTDADGRSGDAGEHTELVPDLRSFPFGNYVLFYRPAESGIEIVRVLHGARDVLVVFGATRE